MEIFADNNSTTPIDPNVLNKMNEIYSKYYGNPSSHHYKGVDAAKVVWESKNKISDLLNCNPEFIYFTSGATESNNWILSQGESILGGGVITSNLEHPSILSPIKHSPLNERCFYLDISLEGDPLIPDKPPFSVNKNGGVLLSVIAAHNEFHFITDVAKLSNWGRENNYWIHLDATQLIGKHPFDFFKSEIDAISISAHKFYGPKGIGALIVNEKLNELIQPLLYGGGQQNDLRSGTIPVPLIAGMGQACQELNSKSLADNNRLKEYSSIFLSALNGNGVTYELIGADVNERLPGCLSFIFPNLDANKICELLPGIAISSSSACKTASKKNNSILNSNNFLRIGFGRFNSREEVIYLANHLSKVGI